MRCGWWPLVRRGFPARKERRVSLCQCKVEAVPNRDGGHARRGVNPRLASTFQSVGRAAMDRVAQEGGTLSHAGKLLGKRSRQLETTRRDMHV